MARADGGALGMARALGRRPMRRPREAIMCSVRGPILRRVRLDHDQIGVPLACRVSILAHREGHARGSESSALPGMPNWSKLSLKYDPSGECRFMWASKSAPPKSGHIADIVAGPRNADCGPSRVVP
jgi:hypothetical protein